MLEIDGSYGEAGGQLLRTSLALAILTRQPLHITRIRAGRKKPGLAAQHMTGILACAQTCGADVEGCEFGSQELTFIPGRIQGDDYVFDVADIRPSAGAVTLVLQAVLPPLLFANARSRLILRGGTNVAWSPPYEYVEHVLVPALAAMGAEIRVQRTRSGWYPQGGGEMQVEIEPVERLQPLNWPRRGELREVKLISTVSQSLPEHILERQLKAMGAGQGCDAEEVRLRPAGNPGTMAMICGQFERGCGGWSSLGERGKRAEIVGEEARTGFERFMSGDGSVDEHLADQLAIFVALADGDSIYKTERVTSHLRTNVWVIEQFLPGAVQVAEDGTVTATGYSELVKR